MSCDEAIAMRGGGGSGTLGGEPRESATLMGLEDDLLSLEDGGLNHAVTPNPGSETAKRSSLSG